MRKRSILLSSSDILFSLRDSAGTLRAVRRIVIHDQEASLRLQASISGLAERVPLVSARGLLSVGQRRALLSLAGLLLVGLAVDWLATLIVLAAFVTVVYVTLVWQRFRLFLRSTRTDVTIDVTDDEARSLPDSALPFYTILIPAYREPEVIADLLEHIGRVDYPIDRLEVLLLVEADDADTIQAVADADPGRQIQLVCVPPSEPRTKPKALNYGFSLAKGDLVAVYDAEDVPEPLQLRRAVVGLTRLGTSVGCVQAKLSYHNPMQNIITKWFTIEYAMWFSFFLPGLASVGAPIPLGGTSNHFRRSVLRTMGAWDPFNVTEDADLGIRMAREGYAIGVLESTTYEEANSDFVNWVRQRSRWYKGYLQTFLVHLRSPRELVREIGWKPAFNFVLFVGGTPVVALLNPIFWLMCVLWFIVHPAFVKELFPAPVYYLGMLAWAFGNFLLVYLTVISCRLIKQGELLVAALLVPLYWVMMSMAAIKAAWQLATQPTHWEKTFHGLVPDHPVLHPDGAPSPDGQKDS